MLKLIKDNIIIFLNGILDLNFIYCIFLFNIINKLELYLDNNKEILKDEIIFNNHLHFLIKIIENDKSLVSQK